VTVKNIATLRLAIVVEMMCTNGWIISAIKLTEISKAQDPSDFMNSFSFFSEAYRIVGFSVAVTLIKLVMLPKALSFHGYDGFIMIYATIHQ
tara:strand:+ start:209 stop:484 length:276 start_codon:yes stop_codon:yes gene_type:complete